MAFRFYSLAVKITWILSLLISWSSIFGDGSRPPTTTIRGVDVFNSTDVFTESNTTRVKLSLLLDGDNFDGDLRVRLSMQPAADIVGSECVDDDDDTAAVSKHELTIDKLVNRTTAIASVEVDISEYEKLRWNDMSLCVLNRTLSAHGNRHFKWLNQGKSVVFRTRVVNSLAFETIPPDAVALPDPTLERRVRGVNTPLGNVHLDGLRLESSDMSGIYEDEGTAEPTLLVNTNAIYRLYGSGWTSETTFVFTEIIGAIGTRCEYIIGEKTKIDRDVLNETSVTMHIHIPPLPKEKTSAILYFCSREPADITYYHVGDPNHCRIKIRERFIPMWVQLVIIVVCLSFSSLFSGLNLGLLSLNRMDLKIISNTGTDTERRYAQAIYPVRIHGNYLLCSILLGNVLVNSIFTILLDDLSSGIVAVVVSTLAIVIVGEICPQAVCSRHGLAIGAKTIYVTKTVMVLTAPLAWPLSRLLDWILGEEIATTYTRERLKELVKITTEFNDLEKDEVNIISGALELRKKTVGEVMTKIEDVYMLSYDTILDFETVSEIMKSGFSRIPVYEGTRRNIVSLLYIKDLALIDPDDNTPLKTLSQFYQNSCYYVFEDTTLDVVFKQFKDGCKGHMAFVHRVNNEGEGDPFYETVGIVTLEDVIEELIQAEIMDETDVYTDNRTKQRRSERTMRNQDFSLFAERSENQRVHLSPQLNLAAFQFLSSSVDVFKPDSISETVLLRLLKHDIVFHIKIRDKEKMKDDPACIIYQQGKPVDYFTLILEGRVEVTVGRESLVFESGPFTHFGSQALMPNVGVAESPTNVAQPMGSLQSVNLESMLRYSFIPDYTVRAVTEVFYLRIKRSHYLAAKKATLLERSKKVSNAGEHFDDEVEKLLHTYEKGVGHNDDDNKSQISREGSFSNPQNIQFIEDSARSSPVNPENSNNGFISGAVSPSRTPHTTDRSEEKTTLLGVSSANRDDRSSNS